ncbi:hypothetical protein [Streptomyces sparsogenes]|uniref:hypothetical protein n=1 Tax=Streptomyces sparsogenes TaxID=67365 RepID=UPI0033EFFC29
MIIATRVPILAGIANIRREDPDCLVGEEVRESDKVHAALTALVAALEPSHPVTRYTQQGLTAVTALVELRPDWAAYCNETFSLDPEASDPSSEMSRLWVSGDTVRSWPRFSEGKAALDAATGPVADLQNELADFCGVNLARPGLGAA